MRTNCEFSCSRLALEGGLRALLALACLSVALAGCGDRLTPRRAVVPTSGRIFHQGKPTAGAMVFLHPTDASGKRADWSAGYPRAMVGPAGDFRFTTYESQDGAPAGKYVLVVTWAWSPPGYEGEGAEPGPDRDAGEDKFQGRFADPETSKIPCVVQGDHVDLGTIELP